MPLNFQLVLLFAIFLNTFMKNGGSAYWTGHRRITLALCLMRDVQFNLIENTPNSNKNHVGQQSPVMQIC